MNQRIAVVGLALLCGCEPRDFTASQLELLRTLTGLEPSPPKDDANEFESDPQIRQLGKRWFFDAKLSGRSTLIDPTGRRVPFGRAALNAPVLISCANCHDPAHAGIDRTSRPNSVSIGAGWFDVNAPSVINAAYSNPFMWNGRADSLWSVSVIALEGAHAMNADRLAVAWHIYRTHRAEYSAAFGGETMDQMELGGESRFPLHGKKGKERKCMRSSIDEPWGDAFDCMADDDRELITTVLKNVGKAIAAYERQLSVPSTAFETYLDGAGSISDAAIRGARLFVGKAACIDCHRTALLSDGLFHNTGVPQSPLAVAEADCVAGQGCLPWGRYFGQCYLQRSEWRRGADPNEEPKPCVPPDDDQKGAWRTPSLRGVAQTAPYMHNGVYATLEDVVWHYDRGGTDSGAAREFKTPELRPLGLEPDEVLDVVAFLESLDFDPLPAALTSSISDEMLHP